MKNAFKIFQVIENDPDDPGTVYLKPHKHPCVCHSKESSKRLFGSEDRESEPMEFANEVQALEAINDHNRDRLNPDSKCFGQEKFAGDFVILNVKTI